MMCYPRITLQTDFDAVSSDAFMDETPRNDSLSPNPSSEHADASRDTSGSEPDDG